MTAVPWFRRSAAWLLIAGAVMAACSCRRSGQDVVTSIAEPVLVDAKLQSNQTAGLSSALYRSQEGSPIHWQPWSRETLDVAEKSKRLLFVVVALPQQPSFLQVLRHMADSPAVVASLNNEYVPVLVDADAARELALLMPELCAEIRRPLHMPVMMWMTSEGNPVGWMPVASQERQAVLGLFDHSHGMISRMWSEDPEYMLKNSAMDNRNRRLRMEERRRAVVYSDRPEQDLLQALRKMTSLYDPYTRTFDDAGGLFPHGTLEFLSVAARQPGIPAELRGKSAEVVRAMLKDLLPSAMFDPLEGGVFSSRRGPSWALPSFQRDCVSQARAVTALVEAWHTTGDAFALERARDVLRFAEGRYRTEDGLFAIGLEAPGPLENWMWTLEEIQELLPEEQAQWWIRESGIKGLGNLPSEADPRREFFRSNSLSLQKPPAVHAAADAAGAEVFLTKYEESRKALLDRRDARMPKAFADRLPHAGATFRMVSAYAAMFTVSADGEYRRKAVELLAAARAAFADGRFLRSMKGETGGPVALGRAFHYALALQAALDVAAITGDKEHLVWAEDLATLAAEQFTGDAILRECPEPAGLLDLPIADTIMLFDDSTAGLYSLSASRMALLERPMVASFRELATPLPVYAVERPVLHTDLLLATMLRHYPVVVSGGEGAPEALAQAVLSLPIRGVQRGVMGNGGQGVVQVRWPEQQERSVDDAEALRNVMAEIRR